MTGDTGAAETPPMRDAAEQLGITLRVVAPGEPKLAALFAARFALIRPDQYVAWRGDHIDDTAGVLRTVCGLAVNRVREPA